MKKSEREFLRLYEETSTGKKKERVRGKAFSRPWAFSLLGASCLALLAVGIILPLSLRPAYQEPVGNASDPTTSVPSWPSEGILVPSTPTYIDTLALADRWKVPTQYEKNLSFVDEGLEIKALDEQGKASYEKAEVETDFQEGKPGTYSVRLNARSGGTVAYEVEVVEQTVTSIRVLASRAVYYVGETPIASDFSLAKDRDDGSSKAAKESEIGLDLSSYDRSAPGLYTIGIYLKGNPSLWKEIEVEVKPLSEISLDGIYLLEEDGLDIGSPLVRAFEIEGLKLRSSYSEIKSEFAFDYVVRDNGLVELDGYGVNQSFTYDPESRVLTVSGIAGDPDMLCRRVASGTSFVKASGPLFDSSDLYCAEGGYLNEETINYLAYRGGGIYLEPSFLTSVDASTYFGGDATVYLGKPQELQVDISSLLNGRYVAETSAYPYPISVTFDEGRLYYYAHYESDEPYIATAKGTYVEIKTYGGDSFRYYPGDGRLASYTVEGLFVENLRKVDPAREIVVSINDGDVTRRDYALRKGDSFPSFRIDEGGTELERFQIEGYDGSPLYEDTSFEEARIGHNYLSDCHGHFGDAKDYFMIGGRDTLHLSDIPMGTYFGIFENYELVDYGKVFLSGFEEQSQILVLGAELEKGGARSLSFDFSALTYEGETKSKNPSFLAGYPFIGSYFKGDDYSDRLDIKDSGAFLIYRYDSETDYRYESQCGFALKEESPETKTYRLEVVVYDDEIDFHLEEARIYFENGSYWLSYRGDTYEKKNVIAK